MPRFACRAPAQPAADGRPLQQCRSYALSHDYLHKTVPTVQVDVRKDGRVRVTDKQGRRATLSNDLQLSNSGEQAVHTYTGLGQSPESINHLYNHATTCKTRLAAPSLPCAAINIVDRVLAPTRLLSSAAAEAEAEQEGETPEAPAPVEVAPVSSAVGRSLAALAPAAALLAAALLA